MIEIPPHTIAQLLYLVHSDPEELREALGELRAPDIAEALRELPPEAAAKVMASLPFELAVQVFDEPELTNSYRIDSDGFITFPMINKVAASGITPPELQDRIRSMLASGYIRNPQVRVEIDDVTAVVADASMLALDSLNDAAFAGRAGEAPAIALGQA